MGKFFSAFFALQQGVCSVGATAESNIPDMEAVSHKCLAPVVIHNHMSDVSGQV